MKTYFFASEEQVAPQGSTVIPKEGFAIGLNVSKFECKSLFKLPDLSPLYHWRRALPIKDLISPRLHRKILRSKKSGFIEVRSSDFRSILSKLRKLQKTEKQVCVVDLAGKEILSTYIAPEKSYVTRIAFPADLTDAIESDYFFETGFRNDFIRHDSAFRRFLHLWNRVDQLYLTTKSTWQTANFCSYFQIKPETTRVLFPEDKPAKAFDWRRPLKNNLVISNLNGDYLPGISDNPDLWSRAIKGMHVKHLFGPLTETRLKKALKERQWDCIIYRGHSIIQDGTIHYPVSESESFLVKHLQCRLYIHLSCVPLSRSTDLVELPARLNVMPLARIEDQKDSEIAQTLLRALISPTMRKDILKSLGKFSEKFYFMSS